MSTFPFLKLPQLAQKVVISQIDLIDIIEISMLSNKIKNVLKQVEIEVDRFEYRFETDSFRLFVSTQIGTLSFSHTLYGRNPVVSWNIDGNNLQVIEKTYKQHSSFTRIVVKSEKDTDESKLRILENLTKHLLSFLKVKNFKLRIETNIDILNLFIWKYTKQFDEMHCYDNFLKSMEVTPDELKLILEDLTIDSLTLNVRIKNHLFFKTIYFKYHSQNEGSSKIRKIHIQNSSWVNFDSLLNMAIESINCDISTGFSEKANEILKKWMSGTSIKLEHLTLWAVGEEKLVKEQVLAGTNATPSAFTKDELEKRSKFSPSFVLLELHTAMDIQRKHDGCQATLILTDKCLRLCVWNDKHFRAIGRT